MLIGFIIGFGIWFVLRCVIGGLFVVEQNERAVKTSFGKAMRMGTLTTHDDLILHETLRETEKERYIYPQLQVIKPGGPYFKWPWETVHKVPVATQLVNIAFDPGNATVNNGNTILEAVTKDQLNIDLRGELRFTVSDRNLYAFLFGVENPVAHIMGYFVSILRERIANFEAPLKVGEQQQDPSLVDTFGISINDLRKNLGDLNHHMEIECASSPARYGISLDAALLTAIEPPTEVESALAAINTAHNHVSSEVSLAQAAADQKIVQSKRAVEIETLKAQAEVQLLGDLATQLKETKKQGASILAAYLRNVRLSLLPKAKRIILESSV
ncbi:MAG: SPFH domain-containing protein [Candidatus Roizmanbacteria bacterium]